jgi:hypothetical protein
MPVVSLNLTFQGVFMRSIISSVAAVACVAIASLTIATSRASPAQLDRITIEAGKKRQVLQHRVDHFVDSVVVQPWSEALYRWNGPVCPLVAGLTREEGEFVLARISQAAVAARAPLDGRVCRPNLYVLATDSPDLLLERWWARDRRMYTYERSGIEAVRSFVHSQRPIRVWYNTVLSCGSGAPATPALSSVLGVDLPDLAPPACTLANSRLIRSSTGTSIESVIVIVDERQMKNVTIEQMADYIALVGLTDVRLDTDAVPESSILQLFGGASAPRGLSAWDRALLYSVYRSNPWDTLQLAEMKSSMVSLLTP